MKHFLHARGLWNFVKDRVKKTQDEANDAFSLYYIQQALDDNIFYVIAEANTAREAWESLKRRFDVRGRYMAESQPTNISEDKFTEAAEDSQIICKSHNCVDILNDENDAGTKEEDEAVVSCIAAVEFEEVEFFIDKGVDVVSNLDFTEVNCENDGMVNM